MISELIIEKSTRHQSIIGHFGEHLACNWLSRSGFEVAVMDHTGIDILAFDPRSGRRLGITVKSRTRNIGAENGHLTLFRKKNRDREKVGAACLAFDCDPWIAVYVETARYGDLFMCSLNHFDEEYRGAKAEQVDIWSMGRSKRDRYASDAQVVTIHVEFTQTNSWIL